MCALVICAPDVGSAQVFTRHLNAGEELATYVPFAVEADLLYHPQLAIDFKAVLEDDRKRGRLLHRAAVKVETDYGISDGVWSKAGTDQVWQIGFSALTASSLNFHLVDLVLPEGAELFVLSRGCDIVHGPVTAAVVYDGLYATDLIEAADVKIAVRVPAKALKQFSLRVAAVNQGIPTLVDSSPRETKGEHRRWTDANDCHLDVNCTQGTGWGNERDAVANIIVNGENQCTATLVNDQCQDFVPYMLTAFHCVDASQNVSIEAGERTALGLWAFRFKYEASIPSCPGNSTGTQGVWLTYSGANFRAASAGTDMALLQLNGAITNQPSIAVAGWDRSGAVPTSTIVIHHPAGDAKKISLDNAAPFQEVSGATYLGPVSSWRIGIDEGAIEGGSSGSAYFDQNHRVFAQHSHRDFGGTVCTAPVVRGGRFDLSWTGGGTNDTRLSNWLAGANPPTTTNTVRVPWISPANPTTTPQSVACSNTTFSLQEIPAGATVNWNVTNPTLFAATGGASTSGSGASAVLRAAGPTVSGSATLTFSIQRVCNGVVVQNTLQNQLYVGLPTVPGTTPTTVQQIYVGESYLVVLTSATRASSFIANWSASGAVIRNAPSGPATSASFRGVYPGTGTWQTTTSNSCGSRSRTGNFNVRSNGSPKGLPVTVTNSVQGALTVSVVTDSKDTSDDLHFQVDASTRVRLFDQSGRSVLQFTFNGASTTRDISQVEPGVYFANVASSVGERTVKLVILK